MEFPPRVPDAHDRAAHMRIDALERSVAELKEDFSDMRDTLSGLGEGMAASRQDTTWIRAGLDAQAEQITQLVVSVREHQRDFDRHRSTMNGSGNLGKALGAISMLIAMLAAALGMNIL